MMEVCQEMQSYSHRGAAMLGLVFALLAGLAVAPVSAEHHGPGQGGSRAGPVGSIPRGSVAVRGTITAVDTKAGTFQLTDRNGLTIILKTSSTTTIQLDGKTAALADLKTNDDVIVVFD